MRQHIPRFASVGCVFYGNVRRKNRYVGRKFYFQSIERVIIVEIISHVVARSHGLRDFAAPRRGIIVIGNFFRAVFVSHFRGRERRYVLNGFFGNVGAGDRKRLLFRPAVKRSERKIYGARLDFIRSRFSVSVIRFAENFMLLVINVRSVITPHSVAPVHYVIIIVFERDVEHNVSREFVARNRRRRNRYHKVYVSAISLRIFGVFIYDLF